MYIVSNDGRKNMKMRKIDLTSFSALQASNLIVKSNDIIYVQPNKWKAFKVASDDFTSPFTTNPLPRPVPSVITIKSFSPFAAP